MNFGTRGRDLVLECKKNSRNHDGGLAFPYNNEGVRATIQEIVWHCDELTTQVHAELDDDNDNDETTTTKKKPSLESRPSLLLHDAAIRRNKRCLLAYHNFRVHQIRQNPTSFSFLSEAEQDWVHSYSRLRAEYNERVGLVVPQRKLPPSPGYVQVRVLQTLGDIVLSATGQTVRLEKGTVHCVPQDDDDIQRLLQQGHLQPLDGEETNW